MSVEGLVIAAFVFTAFTLWVISPFAQRNMRPATTENAVDRQRERLNIYYNRVLRNLHDIDEDHATGKLNEDEYTEERERWVQRGILALKALDELDAQHLVAPEAADDAGIDEAIETTIHAYRDTPV